MARIDEIAKGVGMFVLVNVLLYVAWNLVSNLLDFSTTSDPYLGAFAWISFIAMYVCLGVIYPLYAVLLNADESKRTNFFEALKGLAFWLVGTITSLILYWIIDILVNALPTINITANNLASGASTTISNGGTVSTVQLIAWLGVLVCYIAFFIYVPMQNMLKAFSGAEEYG